MRIPAARSQPDISLPDWGTGVISPKAVWGQLPSARQFAGKLAFPLPRARFHTARHVYD